MDLFFGIDGGGTSCRALVAGRDGVPIGEGKSGSANIMTDLKGARRNIIEASKMALKEAGLTESKIKECDAVVGLAGANISRYAKLIAPTLPFRECNIETDARIALYGALEEKDGAVAIVGTGSVFIAQTNHSIRSIGGWGFAVGDLCSGARLGRTLLQEVLLAYDKVHAGTELTRTIMASFGENPNALVESAQMSKPGGFGKYAPILFEFEEQSDPIAKVIVADAVRDLEVNLNTLIGDEKIPFCLLGGLAENYSKRLSPEFIKRKIAPKGNAVQGALAMALSQFADVRGSKTHV